MVHQWLGRAVALCLAAAAAPAGAQPAYRLVTTIDLPGDRGGHGDWVAFDPDTRTVWLAQTPAHNVVVLDADRLAIKHVVPGIEQGSNIALTPAYAVLADNAGGVVVILDKRTFAPVPRVYPPGALTTRTAYDGDDQLLLVATGAGTLLTMVAEAPFTVLRQVRLRPDPVQDGPDVGLYVPSLHRLYQPVDRVVDVIDPVAGDIATVWQPEIAGRAKPMAYDARTGHFLLGTTDHRMLVIDRDGAVVATIPLPGAVDETALDEALRVAYVGDKAGQVDVVDLDRSAVVASLPSEPDVHTLVVDLASHRVFVYRNQANKVDVFEPMPAQ